MNVRRRSGLMDHSMNVTVRNVSCPGTSVMSQTKPIKNTRVPARAIGPTKVRNAVTGPKG